METDNKNKEHEITNNLRTFTRAEVPEQERWNTSLIFATPTAWEEELTAVKEQVAALAQKEGHICSGASELLQFLNAYMQYEERLGKLRVYAMLNADVDTGDSEQQMRLGKYQQTAAIFAASLSFVTQELGLLSVTRIDEFIGKEPELAFYRQYLIDIVRKAEHRLGNVEEKLLAELQPLLNAPADIFRALNNTDMCFGEVVDGSGNKQPLNHAAYVGMQESQDRVLRANAFEAFNAQYKQYRHTFAATLAKHVEMQNFQAKIRKFDSARAASLFNPHIPERIYDNLVETVNDNLSILHKYVELCKAAGGYEEFHSYDLNAPLAAGKAWTFTFKEAGELVLEAVAPLGKAYQDIVRKALNERWIDWQPNVGKRSGAYSSGAYGTPPYILMSYTGTLSNVYTLAHELGHSVHSYLSRMTQRIPYARYCLFLAEIASTTNEQLLTAHLLKQNPDEATRRYLAHSFLNKAKSTLFRQTQFAEFEQTIHAAAADGQTLTADYLSTVYGALERKYYGPALAYEEAASYGWARIPHFYYNFYVYQYATGFSAATAFAKGILSGDAQAVERYLQFLSSGSSAYPLDILSKAGLDMSTPAPIKSALEAFADYIAIATGK